MDPHHPPLYQPVDPPPEPTSDTMATEIPPEPSNSGGVMKNKPKKKKKKNILCVNDPFDPQSSSAASYASSSCSTTSFAQRGIRVSASRRNPRVVIGSVGRQKSDENVEALALPLGMSIAAVLAQVLERKDAAGEKISVDHLSEICTLAVRESLANVFGDQFESFVRNFEKSFRSTLMTLRLISESSMNDGVQKNRCAARTSVSERSVPLVSNRLENLTCDPDFSKFQSEPCQQSAISDNELRNQEERSEDTCLESIGRQLTLYDRQVRQQLASVSSSMISSNTEINRSVSSTLERSVMEQARSNDLKTFEIGLTMRKLQLKERQLSLSSDANLLERVKLSFGISKTSFKAEKFKNQVEDSKHAELLKTCIDCLVAGLFIMLACLGYGTYVFSHKRITEATASCTPAMEYKSSWWMPKSMSTFNSGLQLLRCQVQVLSRMLFGALMILVIAYLLLQRSAISNQTMPVTFILLLLGVGCGFAGKFCIDTLGGSGYNWLIYWETLCLLHFFSNVCISTLFLILNGPVTVSEKSTRDTRFPYWMRRSVFYTTLLLFLPLLCGMMPFAGPGEWKDHFSSLILDAFITPVEY
ncbi:PREDICTED: protein CPR-5 isoform X2 [Nicotiana attenuata]|uniref:Protein cpr-5 n=1 Tax=Nicotiana attenuata TaxID=49451 RepID=A0A1J6K9U9_NICAT|nr:PREDICTED: protein CPR-5 isoform X2 [Nicotiana attenuata]OIT26858.1 protein cpr-5 [Nicotiana attenuata]